MSALFADVAGTGPAVVLMHGWAMHGGIFAPLVDALADTFTVIFVLSTMS